MKILITCNTGTMRHCLEIFHDMATGSDVELTVVTPRKIAVDRVSDPSGWLHLEREQRCDGFRMIPVPLVDERTHRSGFRIHPLIKVLRETMPDIIHVWDEPVSHGLFRVSWLRSLVARKSKVLFYGFQNIQNRRDFSHQLEWRLTWTQVAGGAVANSEALETLRVLGFPKNRPLKRIFYGIPTRVFRPLNCSSERKALGIDCDRIVGYIGRLVPEKGLEWLLHAVELLPDRVHCLIVGDGPMKQVLEQQSKRPGLRGRVHLVDAKPTDETPRYLNCMDVVAVPSLTTAHWKEQYGRVIPEAMACGVPVVGSDSGAIPEVVGIAGLIVPEANQRALADALAKAIFESGTREKLRQQGHRRVEEALSSSRMARSFLQLYSETMGG